MAAVVVHWVALNPLLIHRHEDWVYWCEVDGSSDAREAECRVGEWDSALLLMLLSLIYTDCLEHFLELNCCTWQLSKTMLAVPLLLLSITLHNIYPSILYDYFDYFVFDCYRQTYISAINSASFLVLRIASVRLAVVGNSDWSQHDRAWVSLEPKRISAKRRKWARVQWRHRRDGTRGIDGESMRSSRENCWTSARDDWSLGLCVCECVCVLASWQLVATICCLGPVRR